MARQRRTRIPGVPSDAERNIESIVREFEGRLLKLERKSGRPGFVSANTAASAGEFLNVEAPAEGLTIIFPEATPALRNARVALAFRNTNPVKLVAIGGTVNREEFVVNTATGQFDAVCNGLDGWEVALGVSSSGSAFDAQYVLGAAHGSLPNGAVATDSTEINVTVTPGTTATWALIDGSVGLPRFANVAAGTFLGNVTGSTGPVTANSLTTLAGGGLTYALGIMAVGAGTGLTVNANDVQLSAIAADSFFLNPTALSAVPSAVAGATVAGAGLTYTTGGILAVGAGTGLTVNANDVQLSTGAAETFFGNFTAGVAVGTYRAGSSVAGAGLTYTAGGTLAVGSSTSIIVGANDVQRAALTGDVTAAQDSNATTIAADAVTNPKLANMASPRLKGRTTALTGDPEDLILANSTSATWNTATGGSILVERAALAGAISAAANSNTTQFAGIRDNGTLETARGFINVLSSATITALITPDAVNDEHEWTWSVNLAANYAWTGVHSFIPGGAGTFFVQTTSTATISGQAVQLLANGALSDLVGTATRDVSLTATRDFTVLATEAINLTSNGNTTDRINLTANAGRVDLTALETVIDSSGSAGGFLRIKESAASTPSVPAGYGTYWVQSLTPNVPMFTDDANTDHQLAYTTDVHTAVQSASGIPSRTNSVTTNQGVGHTVLSNTFAADTVYAVEGRGVFSRGATATACTLTFELLLGGTVYATCSSTTFTVAGTGYFRVMGEIKCLTAGALGTFVGNIDVDGDFNATFDVQIGSYNTAASATTKDTTSTQSIVLRVTMSAPVANCSTFWTHAAVNKVI